MVLGTEGSREELLTPAGWKKDDGVSQVNDGHSTAVIEPPAVPDCCWD
jgi:hypothetical protein